MLERLPIPQCRAGQGKGGCLFSYKPRKEGTRSGMAGVRQGGGGGIQSRVRGDPRVGSAYIVSFSCSISCSFSTVFFFTPTQFHLLRDCSRSAHSVLDSASFIRTSRVARSGRCYRLHSTRIPTTSTAPRKRVKAEASNGELRTQRSPASHPGISLIFARVPGRPIPCRVTRAQRRGRLGSPQLGILPEQSETSPPYPRVVPTFLSVSFPRHKVVRCLCEKTGGVAGSGEIRLRACGC